MDDPSTKALEPHIDSSHSKPHGIFRWLFWSLTILLFYVLSAGPAYKLEEAALLSPDLVSTIYAPIEYGCLWCEPAGRLYVWYLSLWGIHVIVN